MDLCARCKARWDDYARAKQELETLLAAASSASSVSSSTSSVVASSVPSVSSSSSSSQSTSSASSSLPAYSPQSPFGPSRYVTDTEGEEVEFGSESGVCECGDCGDVLDAEHVDEHVCMGVWVPLPSKERKKGVHRKLDEAADDKWENTPLSELKKRAKSS